jgi:CheY-like chemotaxis protein
MIHILLVEDDAAIRETLSAILREDDVDVTLCTGAGQAAEMISHNNFDLVITDMRMETPTSGCDVIRAARSTTSPPPVVVLTAFPLARGDSRASGASTVLLKGSDPHVLIRQIHQIVTDLVSHKLRPRSA